MSRIISISLFLLFVFPFTVRAEHDGKIQILLLGDSTTEGSIPRRLKPEGPHLEEVIQMLLAAESDLPPCHVINSSRGGEFIRRLIDSRRYEKDASQLPGIDYIFIRYGINDRAKRDNFPVNFPADFQELLTLLRKDHPDALIIPMTVIPFSKPEATKEMNDLIFQVARENKLPVFDIHPRYAQELKKGVNMLNYRRYPLEKIPEIYREMVKPYVHDGRVEIMGNEFDAIFGDLPDWTGDRHPNLAGYNVIADETAKFLAPLLRERAARK
ncbi:MAG: SGNH/GDSL hydrolase family protein [Verrucomicrobiales bacterium]|nr:SGNH/GDSL hydrolase family protein [Verrucomicrobiales bacterium]